MMAAYQQDRSCRRRPGRVHDEARPRRRCTEKRGNIMADGWKLTWFGPSAFRLEAGSSIILIDPFLTGNPSFSGSVEAASAGATHIVLTHGHDDHIGDAAAISKRTGAQVVSNYEICMFLYGQGVHNINTANTVQQVSPD